MLSANDALERLGLQKAPEDMIRRTVGLSLKNTYVYLTGIVTTKFHYRIDQILQKYNAAGLVDRIVGSGDVTFEKPSPEGLLYIINELKVSKKQVLYIGDSLVDAETAEAAGVDFFGVLTGTTSREDFRRFPNIFIADQAAQLTEYLSENRKGVKS